MGLFSSSNSKWLAACKSGKIEKVRELLASGSDVNEQNKKGDTALSLAYGRNHYDVCILLIENGADVSGDLGFALLMKVLQEKNSTLCNALISGGADIHRKNKLGTAPLTLACLYGLTDTVELLLSKSVDSAAADEDGVTALMAAAIGGHLEITKALLVAGARPEVANNAGKTAAQMAAERGKDEIAAFLADYSG